MNRSVYLTKEEDARLLAFAKSTDLRVNTCIAIAVRSLLGMSVPRWAEGVVREALRDKEEAPVA